MTENKLKTYVVINRAEPEWNSHFIVKANNATEARQKVWRVYGEDYRKLDFSATEIDSLEYEDGISCIN